MLKQFSLKALEKAINKALGLDENMPSKLFALDQKVVEIIIRPLQVNFFIHFDQGKLCLLDHYSGHPDTIIHSSPIGLIRLSLLPASKARSLFNDKVRMSGDIELGQKIKLLFDELDIDWEGHLAFFTGDVVAHQIGSFVRKSFAFKQQLSDSLRHNVKEYLHEEVRLFPSRQEVDDFFHDLDELVLATDRLQAQMNQLILHHDQ